VPRRRSTSGRRAWIECSDEKKLKEFTDKAYENLAIDGGGTPDYMRHAGQSGADGSNAGRRENSAPPTSINCYLWRSPSRKVLEVLKRRRRWKNSKGSLASGLLHPANPAKGHKQDACVPGGNLRPVIGVTNFQG